MGFIDSVIKAICEKNECYLVGETIKPKGIVVHSTGANNPNLSRYCDNVVELGDNKYNNHWNQFRPGGRQVCVHAFIGLDKNKNVKTAQTLPWNRRCWGCGKGSKGTYNDSHIQFEICEDGLTDSIYFNKVYTEAVQLCVYLCKEYNIEPKNIVCHKEAYRAGYGSNHADVSIKDLNIRTGAGTNYSKTGKYTGAGVFTITEVKQGAGSKKGWGKLKSGAGWISLDYCEVIYE